MPTNLKTDWKTIGRTGLTIDGREITEEMAKDVVELYDPDAYRAVVRWEHYTFMKLGTVEALRLQKNSEGGFDIQAILVPNQFWLDENANDQKTFTSMELTQVKRFDNRWYLTGLGATDTPASFGTTELRFNKQEENVFRGTPVEFSLDIKPETKTLFSRLFSGKPKPEETDVDKELIEALKAFGEELKGIRADFTALKKPEDKPGDKPDAEKTEAFKALETKLSDLENRLGALDEKFSKLPAPVDHTEKLTALEAKLGQLTEAFNKAISEADSNATKPNPPADGGGDLKAYI